MTVPTTTELLGANGPPAKPTPAVVPIRPLVGSPPTLAREPAQWLTGVATNRLALDDADGWYQRALAVDSGTSGVRVVSLPEVHLSTVERSEIQALTGSADTVTRATATWSVMVKAEQRVVSHAGIAYRVIQVGDLRVPVGGIGGVATQTEWRGRGYARAVLESARAFIGTQLWAPFAVVICLREQTAFFEKLGWRVGEAAVWCEQPTGRVLLANQAAVFLPCQGSTDWPSGLIDLCGAPW